MHNWAIVNRFTAQNFIILQDSVTLFRTKSPFEQKKLYIFPKKSFFFNEVQGGFHEKYT